MTAARSVRAASAGAVAVALPRAAWACAVCAGQDDAAVSLAILKGTALLSLLPLALIGGLVWFLRRRAREIESARGAFRAQESPR